jgi:hypothetical protein
VGIALANIPGTNVAAPVVPFTTGDIYATHSDAYGQGGYRSVADITERDALPLLRRSHGMLVYVISEDKTYQLKTGVTNLDWVEFITAGTGGGGGSTPKHVVERPVGAIDSVNTYFVTSKKIFEKSLFVFVNGICQTESLAADYTRVGDSGH